MQNIDFFEGYRLIATPYFADTVQRRTHKKKRINKKWKKKYGTMQKPWNKLIMVDGKIYGHPKIIEKIKTAIELERMKR